MKRLSTMLAATALLALGACGSRTANNTAVADNLTNDVYDVAPDSMGANDLGNDTSSGNASSTSNSSSTSNASSGSNASHGSNSSSSHASGNSSR